MEDGDEELEANEGTPAKQRPTPRSVDELRVAKYHERLLLFRPLAHLTNAFIEGFNELRKCASISIQERVRQSLIELIGLADKAISQCLVRFRLA